MGCDIHTFVERKEEGKYKALKGKNRFYGSWEDEKEFVFNDWIYDGKNYELFAILADVRNSYNITPIAEPRGIPENASDEIKQKYDEWGVDGHSTSWYTFEELLTFDSKDKFFESEGFVDERGYRQFKENGKPDSWCRNVGGLNVEKVLNYEMERVLEDKYPWEKETSFYTAVKWKVCYSEVLNELLSNIKSFVKENNVKEEELKSYRMVFWFDN